MSCSYYDANSISSPITGSSNFSCTNTTRNSTMNPWAGISADDYLAELDARYSDRVFPAMFFLGVLMVAGVVGNAAVLYVYTCRARRQGGTVTRFIQALAVFDLLSCCLAIPGEIMDMRNNYTFGRSPLCKLVRTVNLFCTLTSGITLIVVALDRYKRICCPLKRQISPRGAAIIVCLASVIASILSSPTAVIYGRRSVDTANPLVKGADCSIGDRYVKTIIPLVYNGVQMLLFLIGFFTLLVLYVFIARRIWRHEHQRLQRRRSTHVGAMAGVKKGQRFPTSPSDAPSSSPPTTELASPMTLTPEEQKTLHPDRNTQKNIFFKDVETLKTNLDHQHLPRNSFGVGGYPGSSADQARDQNVNQEQQDSLHKVYHRRCSSDPHYHNKISGRKRGLRNSSMPEELAGSVLEIESWDRDSGICADSTPPGSAVPDDPNNTDGLSRPGKAKAPLTGQLIPLSLVPESSDLVLMAECPVHTPDNFQSRTLTNISVPQESRFDIKRNSLPSSVLDGYDKMADVTESATSVAELNVMTLKTLSTPVLPNTQIENGCHVSLIGIDQNVGLTQCVYESSTPEIPLLKASVELKEGGDSKREDSGTTSKRLTKGCNQDSLAKSEEIRPPRVVGSCGNLAQKKPREPHCHRRLGSSAASIVRSEGDHMTVCSITLSEDDGETEEEILGETRDGSSMYTTSPESTTENRQCRKCSHKSSITSRQSLRARLANSTTNLLAKLVSNEKSVSEWDATLEISDVEMDTLRRSTRKHSSSRKKLKLSEPRRTSEGSHAVTYEQANRTETTVEEQGNNNGHTGELCRSNNPERSSKNVEEKRRRNSTNKDLHTTPEPHIPERDDEERQEKKVLFRGSSHTQPMDDRDCQLQSDEPTEEKETSQEGEGKVSLRTRRRGSSFRGFKELKFRRFSLKSDTPGIRRTTLILFLISLVYIVSFLPHLVMMTLKALKPQAVAGDGREWTVVSNLVIRSYFLNSVANPFIYTFLSKNFVRKVRGSFNRWSRRRTKA